MLDGNDKRWIIETIDEKLDDAKAELRGEMQEMKAELRGEMQEMKAELRGEMQEMKAELCDAMENLKTEMITAVTAQITMHTMTVFENTYQHYMELIAENIPDKIRSYDRIEENQNQQEQTIRFLKDIAADHDKRITRLEKAVQ